ncbi:MAG: response regulator [Pseudomonadota bacterium]
MGEPARILTIEDEQPVRSGIVAYLQDSGFSVLEANDGLTGIDIFRHEHPDVVLCDLRLPGMNGLEVLSTISSESPDTPVIVVSGVSLIAYAVQALKRGAWDYITKPIHDMEVLESAIHRVLDHARLINENREYQKSLEKLNQELEQTLGRLREDEETGRRIQHQLLPEDDKTLGAYHFQRRLYPSMYLSGDFVDYFAIDAAHIGFYMADVSGHGAASAFVTIMLKTLMGQYCDAFWQEGDDTILHPAQTLSRLNCDLCRQQLDKYLTMFYGVLDGQENTLLCSNGGQFPYPILHDGDTARLLTYRGRPVGLFEDSDYTDDLVDLPGTFVLVLVSDGILELLPMDFMQERAGDLRARISGCDLTMDRLTRGLGIEQCTGLPDDVAILIVKRDSSHE